MNDEPTANAGYLVQLTTMEIEEAASPDTQAIFVSGKAICARYDIIIGDTSEYKCEPLPEPPLLENECRLVASLGDALGRRVGPLTYIGLSRRLAEMARLNPPRELQISGSDPNLPDGASLVGSTGPVVPLAGWADEILENFEAGAITSSIQDYPFQSARTAFEAACGTSLSADPLYDSYTTGGAYADEEGFASLLADPIYPFPLRVGDDNEGVRLFQEALDGIAAESGDNTLSVGASGPDGRFGHDTARAVISLQEGELIDATGVVDDVVLYWLRFRQECYVCGRD